ncbi:MAG: hypothetical protein ABIW36_10455 [Terrimesophilobacter sp.]
MPPSRTSGTAAELLAGWVVLIAIGLGPEQEKMVPVIRSAGGESPPAPMRAGQTGTNEFPSN